MERKVANFRTKVMKYSWQIWRSTGDAWSECMVKAWQLHRLSAAMREGVVSFRYRKADGSVREAHGTLMGIPAGATCGGKRLTKPSYKTLAYWDTEKLAFRCFKAENLLAV